MTYDRFVIARLRHRRASRLEVMVQPPSDLPVWRPTRYEFVINRQTAPLKQGLGWLADACNAFYRDKVLNAEEQHFRGASEVTFFGQRQQELKLVDQERRPRDPSLRRMNIMFAFRQTYVASKHKNCAG